MGGEAGDAVREWHPNLLPSVDERARLRVLALLAKSPPRSGACFLCDRIAEAKGTIVVAWGFDGGPRVETAAQVWHLEHCWSRTHP